MGKCDYSANFIDNLALCCLHELMKDMAPFLLTLIIDEIILLSMCKFFHQKQLFSI